MRIALFSHCFAPSIGGIETVSRLLAASFGELGHQVSVLTQTPTSGTTEDFGYPVVRQPSASAVWQAVRTAHVILHNNISLRTAWPLLLTGRRWVVTHQTWLTRVDGTVGPAERLKRLFLRRAHSVAISRAVAAHLPVPSTVIPNPYDDRIFHEAGEQPRDRELIFVGRLVSDKGVDVLLTALGILSEKGLRPVTTIVGSGPELSSLQTQAEALGLTSQVTFAGPQSGHQLAATLRRHRILVVPSRWAEPFGIVALEGLACGCVSVGSEGGGLPDAMGPCGLTFPNGDAAALAAALERLLATPGEVERLRAAQPAHLARFRPRAIAEAYVDVFTGSSAATPAC